MAVEMKYPSPSPEQVLSARQSGRLPGLDGLITQAQAAEAVDVTLRTWQHWEAGSRAMPPGLYRLFCILTSQGDPKPKQQ
jgi:DNA-binding transcriptional regulator YiaG